MSNFSLGHKYCWHTTLLNHITKLYLLIKSALCRRRRVRLEAGGRSEKKGDVVGEGGGKGKAKEGSPMSEPNR